MSPSTTPHAPGSQERSPDSAPFSGDLPTERDDAGTLTRQAPSARPHVVVLDLDGVLRYWDPAIVGGAAADAGLPDDALALAAFGDEELLRAAVTGALSDEEWRDAIVGRLAERFGRETAAAAVAAWSVPAGEVRAEVLALVREVRRAVPVALFSNATSRLSRDLDTLGLAGEVDLVINSSELGVAKPDPAAFLAAAERCGHAPQECLFVDDTETNVVGARSTGMNAHLFTTAAGMQDLLSAVGLL